MRPPNKEKTMSDGDGIADLDAQAEALEDSLGAAASMAAGFDAELRRMRESFAATGRDVATLERGLSKGLRRAFDGVVFDGMKLSDALETVARSMIDTTYSAAIKPVTNRLGGLLAQGVSGLVEGILPFADGAGFAQGRVMPFVNGGVVSGPVSFAMRGGTGLMGEAGPEAIMPLTRGADGKLGVRSSGGGAVNVVMNITTPDAQGFQRSRGQIAAQMGRALGRGNRNR
jgi:phage-related minor tail protein